MIIVEIEYSKYQLETLEDAQALMNIMSRAKHVEYMHELKVYKLKNSEKRDIEITITNKKLIEEAE